MAVIGRSGSGKSSLLQAMLGEMPHVIGVDGSDTQMLHGSRAYVPQTAWIFNATIEENVLCGKSYDESKFCRAISVSQMTPDLEAMPGGRLTEIGERGSNMSGGQKQRVSIARAVYADADTCILDDPLSALDPTVQKKVFKECILGELATKTRVVAMNQLHFVPDCDYVVFLEDGHISEQGTFEELIANKGAFSEMYSTHVNVNTSDVAETVAPAAPAQLFSKAFQRLQWLNKVSAHRMLDLESEDHEEEEEEGDEEGDNRETSDSQPKEIKLLKKELQQTGSIAWEVYKRYGMALGVYTTRLLDAYCVVCFRWNTCNWFGGVAVRGYKFHPHCGPALERGLVSRS